MTTAILIAALIHGGDGRRELFEIEDPALAELARRHTVALVREGPVRSFRESAQLCAEERFGDQPVRAFCSGVLVDADTVLTAGHCVPDEEACASITLAIGWRLAPDGSALEERSHRCRGVEVHDPNADFALLRIDPPAEVQPLPTSADLGGSLAVVGHPAGLPAKIDEEAMLLGDGDGATFSIAADTFAGSSGSAIYGEDLALAGILLRGRADFRYDFDRGCFASRRADRPGGELALRAETALASLRGCGGGGSLAFLLFPLVLTRRRPIRCDAADGGAHRELIPR